MPGSQPHRILVIDDSEVMLHTVREWLQMGGYEVETLSSPIMALFRINDFQPHLVLLDLDMPGLSGSDLLDTIRRILDDTLRVVFYSSRPLEELQLLAQHHGANGVLRKDDQFQGGKLLRNIRQFLVA